MEPGPESTFCLRLSRSPKAEVLGQLVHFSDEDPSVQRGLRVASAAEQARECLDLGLLSIPASPSSTQLVPAQGVIHHMPCTLGRGPPEAVRSRVGQCPLLWSHCDHRFLGPYMTSASQKILLEIIVSAPGGACLPSFLC